MSTDEPTPDDETQVLAPVDGTRSIDVGEQAEPDPVGVTAEPDPVGVTAEPDLAGEPAEPDLAREPVQPDAVDEPEAVDETEVLAQVDDVQAVDDTLPGSPVDLGAEAEVDTPLPIATAETAPTGLREPEAFDLFTPAPTSPAAPARTPAPAADPPTPVRRRMRVGTVVWGLVLAACGLGVVAWASGARIDFQLALIVLLAVAGSVLLVGSILSGARHARR